MTAAACTTNTEVKTSEYWCKVCKLQEPILKLSPTQVLMTSHMAGSRHQKNMVASNELLQKLRQQEHCFVQDTVAGMLKCLVCNLEMDTPHELEEHLAGTMHRSKVAADYDADHDAIFPLESSMKQIMHVSSDVPTISSYSQMSLCHKELEYQTDLFSNNCDGDDSVCIVDEIENYYTSEEDCEVQILNQSYSHHRGSLYHNEELLYGIDMFNNNCNEDSICIIDKVKECYTIDDDCEIQVPSQICKVSNGLDQENLQSVYSSDDTLFLSDGDMSPTSTCLVPHSDESTPCQVIPSEAAIDELISLGRHGLLHTNITEPTSACFTADKNIEMCKFFLKGKCKYGASGKDGGMCKYSHINSSIWEHIDSRSYSSSKCKNKRYKKNRNKAVAKRLKASSKGVPKRLHPNGLKHVHQWLHLNLVLKDGF